MSITEAWSRAAAKAREAPRSYMPGRPVEDIAVDMFDPGALALDETDRVALAEVVSEVQRVITLTALAAVGCGVTGRCLTEAKRRMTGAIMNYESIKVGKIHEELGMPTLQALAAERRHRIQEGGL